MTASGISAQWGMAEELYVNEVQQISGTPSGTFGLSFDGANTVTTLAITESAANIQAALNALPNMGAAGVVCAGGPLPTAVTVTFSGPAVAKRNVPLLAVQGGVTGLVFATNTPGTGYGDPVTVTRFLEFADEGLQINIGRMETKSIRSGNRFQRTDRWAASKRQAAGDINFEAQSKGMSMLLGHMFGSAPIITTPAGGTLTRDHTITPGDEAGRSMTMQIGTPDANNVIQPFTYNGVKIVGWEFDLATDGLLLIKCTVDAQNEITTTALAVASFAASFEMLYWTGGSASIGGGLADVKSFKLAGNQNYNVDRFYNRASTTAGAPNLKKEPLPNGFAEYTGEVVMDFNSLTEYNRFTAGTTAALVLVCEGSVIEAITGGPAKVGLQFTIPFARYDSTTADVKGMDITEQSLQFKCLWDGTTPPFTCRYRTTDTVI